MIYAVQILNLQFVKIGYSANDDVARRIAELQTGCPFKIAPVFTVSGSIRQEKALHSALFAAFAQVRIPIPPNEWYPGRNQFFKQFLDALKFGADMGLAHCDKFGYLQNCNGIKKGMTVERHNLKPNIRWVPKADPKAVRAEFPGLI